MKLRIATGMNSKPFWFIITVALIGAGLIYFLNSIGVIEAMRNDNTLDYVYEANFKLPKAPGNVKPVTTAPDNSDPDISSLLERDKEILRIESIIKNAEEKKVDINKNVGNHISGLDTPKENIIPHIIHQTWDTFQIPKSLIENMKSWMSFHPGWDYWLWTTRAVECFIERYYSSFSTLYESYPNPTSKADAMRYFILHKYGGVYVDLDTRSLKPLDVWTKNFCCILTEEPYEHSFIVREENSTSIVNSPMACVAGHKLFSDAINSLPQYAGKFFGDYLKSTGPAFLAEMYKNFHKVKTHTGNYMKGHSGKLEKENCKITVTPPNYFLPRYDPSQGDIISSRCSIRDYKQLPEDQKRVCLDLIHRDYKNTATSSAFMDHDWLHVDLLGPKWKSSNTVSFFDIFPKAKNLETYFCGR